MICCAKPYAKLMNSLWRRIIAMDNFNRIALSNMKLSDIDRIFVIAQTYFSYSCFQFPRYCVLGINITRHLHKTWSNKVCTYTKYGIPVDKFTLRIKSRPEEHYFTDEVLELTFRVMEGNTRILDSFVIPRTNRMRHRRRLFLRTVKRDHCENKRTSVLESFEMRLRDEFVLRSFLNRPAVKSDVTSDFPAGRFIACLGFSYNFLLYY